MPMNNAEKKSVETDENNPNNLPAAASLCVPVCDRDSGLEQRKGLLLIWSVECHGPEQDTVNIKIAGCSYTWYRAVRGSLQARCTWTRQSQTILYGFYDPLASLSHLC